MHVTWSRLDLGVGIIALGAFDHVWSGVEDLVEVVEVEPQTLWRSRFGDGRVIDPAALEWLRGCGRPLLAHGVGFPVGGTTPPDPEGVAASGRSAADLGAVHWSEHLAFNAVGDRQAGYLLPPVQTRAGAAAAARHIAAYREAFDAPFLVETPTSYLRPEPGDLRDGEYVAAVAEGADCGILLDLHNIWANERNGRQRVADHLDDLPLDRVWEVHLAGGFETAGYYLDAHVGPVDPRLLELAAEVLPRLPHVRAVVYEAVPASISGQGVEGLRAVLASVHDAVGPTRVAPPTAPEHRPGVVLPVADPGATRAREEALLGFTTRARSACPGGDPGAALIRSLTDEARLSLLVRDHPDVLAGLLADLGEAGTDALLRRFLTETAASAWVADEAGAFEAWARDAALVAHDAPGV